MNGRPSGERLTCGSLGQSRDFRATPNIKVRGASKRELLRLLCIRVLNRRFFEGAHLIVFDRLPFPIVVSTSHSELQEASWHPQERCHEDKVALA